MGATEGFAILKLAFEDAMLTGQAMFGDCGLLTTLSETLTKADEENQVFQDCPYGIDLVTRCNVSYPVIPLQKKNKLDALQMLNA